MIKKYYIQVGAQSYKDIFEEFGIMVQETVGLTALPDIKKPFSRDWKDEQGIDVYLPDDMIFKDKDVKIKFLYFGTDSNNVKRFINHILSENTLSYFDTYKNSGFRGFYEKEKLNKEQYRQSSDHIEFEMTFTVPNGLSFGFDNTGNYSIFVDIDKGYADLYYSNGDKDLNKQSFIKNTDAKFIIINPSVYNAVTITARTRKVLGINSKVLGINNKIIGI